MVPKILFAIFGIAFLIYLVIPEPSFPGSLWDFKASTEPADKETPLRRGYYTNLTREQVTSHYSKEFGWGIRLNYPPEDAQTLIRDQTRSTFLEEIVHPFRESIFVNGFEPKDSKDDIWYQGQHFRQKIIIRYVQSNMVVRLIIFSFAYIGFYFLVKEWKIFFKTTSPKI